MFLKLLSSTVVLSMKSIITPRRIIIIIYSRQVGGVMMIVGVVEYSLSPYTQLTVELLIDQNKTNISIIDKHLNVGNS